MKKTKKTANTQPLKWYEKASKKRFTQDETGEEKNIREEQNTFSHTRKNSSSSESRAHNHHRKNAKPKTDFLKLENALFDSEKIPEDARKILNTFDKIFASSKKLTSKQQALLPQQIRSLSHELTDERGSRHLSYMNQTTTVTAYISYYMWWNLVRLVKLFSNLPENAFNFPDEEICLDIGSGPLTVPTALFLSRPELRSKKLTWYCLDISSAALSEGENLFYTIAAKLECEPWKIIRVKGELGTSIRQKAGFITAANVFNEIVDDSEMPPDYLAKKYSEKILSYTDNSRHNSKLLIIEPGVPKSARFISLLRSALMRKNYIPDSPCTHCAECPMDGKRGGKWCNFAFNTDDAPASLKKLSEAARLPKERAVLSFLLCTECEKKSDEEKNAATGETIYFRITSDVIKIPADFENGKPFTRTGYYACSDKGLLLVLTPVPFSSGQTYSYYLKQKELQTDKKSGALMIDLY